MAEARPLKASHRFFLDEDTVIEVTTVIRKPTQKDLVERDVRDAIDRRLRDETDSPRQSARGGGERA